MALQTVMAGKDDDLQQVMEEYFGKAFFHCKSKPTSAALRDRIAGKITKPDPDTGKRKTYWIIAKPSRQQGNKPKEKVTITLDADLLKELDDLAEAARDYRSTLVEAALRAFLPVKRGELGL